MEIEKHHLTNTTAIVVEEKNHQQVLKLGGESIMRDRISAESQSVFPQEMCKLKGKYSNFAVETPSTHHLSQMIEVHITNKETSQYHMSLYMMQEKGDYHF